MEKNFDSTTTGKATLQSNNVEDEAECKISGWYPKDGNFHLN